MLLHYLMLEESKLEKNYILCNKSIISTLKIAILKFLIPDRNNSINQDFYNQDLM